MKERGSKYLKQSETDPLHIGHLVAWIIQEKHLKKADIARQLNVLPTTLNQYFKQPSVQMGILWRLSKATKYNFLADLGQRVQIDFETQKETALQKTLAEKEEAIKILKIELNLLKKIHKIE